MSARISQVVVFTNNHKFVIKTSSGSYTKTGPFSPPQPDRTVLYSDEFRTTIDQSGKVTQVSLVQPVSASVAPSPVGAGSSVQAPAVSAINPPVTPPVQGISLYPGDDFMSKVNSYPAGTTFIVRKGAHVGQSVAAPNKNNIQFIGEPGAVLKGNGKPYAFAGLTGTQAGDNWLIKNMEITEYAPARQSGVIQPWGEAFNWVLEDLDIHHNANLGIKGADTVRRCRVHHQGSMGLGGMRLLEDCEVYSNNTEPVNPGWEGGGSKWVWSAEVTARRCFFHDNYGCGLWTDGNIKNILFEDNKVWDNFGAGIFIEISSDAIIRNNDVRRNGFGYTGWIDGAGILVGDSPRVEIYGNTVVDNNDGIAGKHSGRTDGAHFGPLGLKNLYVHDNIIVMHSGQTGIARTGEASADPVYDASWNNRFRHNTYTLGTGTDKWYYGPSGAITKAQWQALGQDLDSVWSG